MTDELEMLIVDDNDGCRELYALWLGEEHDIRMARNGKEACDIYDKDIDLVILDRNMPGPNGREVAVQLRENGFDGGILMASSKECDFDVVSSAVDCYLQKPVDRESVQKVINCYCKQHAYQSALDEYYAVSETLASLEAALSKEECAVSEKYTSLKERVTEKREAVDEFLENGELEWYTAFCTFNTGQKPSATESGITITPQRQHS